MVLTLERPATQTLPPLCAGDRLTRAEFEHRWDLHPEIKRAELIDGEVYLEMSVGADHADAHFTAITWAGLYRSRHPGVRGADNGTVRLGDDALQPDIALYKRVGGTASVGPDRVLDGPPELVFEVAASSASIDLHKKLPVYERAGVAEYVVWQLYENKLDWFRLVDGKYEAIEPDAEGVIESSTFPGLRLDVPALLADDLAKLLAALR